MMGATIQAQTNCQTMEGHLDVSTDSAQLAAKILNTYHSHPLPCFMAISMGLLPVTSVPGMPKSGWNLREIM